MAAIGDYKEALEKYNDALKIFDISFGKNHPDVAAVLNNIAAILQQRGYFDEALEKYNESIMAIENIYGKRHPEYAKRLNNIAGTLSTKGDLSSRIKWS